MDGSEGEKSKVNAVDRDNLARWIVWLPSTIVLS